jgi:hypothetical protein
VTWICVGPAWGLEEDEDTPDNQVVWTWVGPVAVWTESNRVHSLATGDAGQLVLDLSAGNKTLTEAEAASLIIKATNTAAARTITFPTPANDASAYQRTIRNTTTGALTVELATGATVVVAASKTAIVGFDASGVFRITADA